MQFSVLMAVYNQEKPAYFEAALKSVVEQTLLPNEIVLIIDGPISTELQTVIDHFKLNYPHLFQIILLDKNMGLGYALQIGVLACSYEIIARMDTDDIALPQRFQKQIDFLKENKSFAIVGANVEEFNSIPGDSKIFKRMPEKGQELIDYAKYRNPFNHPTIVFRKSAVIAAGNYTSEIRLFEDYMLFIRMLLKSYQFYNIQEDLLYFRVGNKSEYIKRRSGLHYLKKELRFLIYAKRLKYLNEWEFIRSICTKPIIRILPTPIILWGYKFFLRKQT